MILSNLDESCYNNDLGCGCDTPAAEDGYDCNGDCLNDTDGDVNVILQISALVYSIYVGDTISDSISICNYGEDYLNLSIINTNSMHLLEM